MSCVPEVTWLLYVDGELEDVARRTVEAHLVACEVCRARVVALREEGELLTRSLASEVAPPRRVGDAEAGLALGLPLTLAAVVAAGAVGTALLERVLPTGFAWLNPVRLAGAYEMLFDVFFLARDRAPGLLELTAAIAATAVVAALLAAAAGALARRLGGAALSAALAALLLAPGTARAIELRSEDKIAVERGERLAETLVASAESVRIDGVLEGDLAVATERLTITGTVEGDVFCWARDVDVSGTVTGSIRCGAERFRLDGVVEGAVHNFGENLEIGEDGRVGRDAFHGGRRVELDGAVGRDLVFLGDELLVAGAVGRNVQVFGAEEVRVAARAVVGGDLRLTLEDEDALEVASGATVRGEVVPVPPLELEGRHGLGAPGVYVWIVVRFAAAFLFGVVVYALFPQLFAGRIPDAGRFLRTLGVGFAVLVATPLALVVAALTLIGLPLAVLGLFAYVGAAYLGLIAAAALIGRGLLGFGERGELGAFARALAVGLLIATLAVHVPWVGGAVRVVLLLVGLGLVFDQARAALYVSRSS